MSEKVQLIRRSQFVTTYGPGSIIEGRNGPRVIPALDIGLGRYFSQDMLKKFEILDIRMTHLVNGAGIFALPSNAALKKNDNQYIYKTMEFPVWRICSDRKFHNSSILYDGYNSNGSCPLCSKRGEPIRFIAACPDGHMDDIPWNFFVHGKGNKKCKGWFRWLGGGSSVKNIVIECPDCHKRISMGNIYSRKWRCSGRFPERDYSGSFGMGECESNMAVIQRQATNLRIPEVVTLLTIPKYDTEIARIIQNRQIADLIEALEDAEGFNESSFNKALVGKAKRGKIKQISIDIIENYTAKNGWKDFLNLCGAIIPREEKDGHTYKNMLVEEFISLKNSSENGFNESANFKIRKSKRFNLKLTLNNLVELHVAAVDTLRTVTTQVGYRRMPYLKSENEPESNDLVPIEILTPTSGEKWLPGFESLGEGLFLTSVGNPIGKDVPASREWDLLKCPSGTLNEIKDRVEVRNPLFVWWHTLSHALIKTLSLYSGYSSSALRERVYFDDKEKKGGVLIYAAMSGEDGGMGGLTGSVANFEEILSRALNLLNLCSNDPLCIEHRIKESDCNGAACHSCLLISETSCEHRNMWLDRHLLLGD